MSEAQNNIFSEVIQHFGKTETGATITRAAAALEISIQTACNYRDGRPVPPELCIKIEKLSKRKFLCEQLRPDMDWAYLRGTKKKVA